MENRPIDPFTDANGNMLIDDSNIYQQEIKAFNSGTTILWSVSLVFFSVAIAIQTQYNWYSLIPIVLWVIASTVWYRRRSADMLFSQLSDHIRSVDIPSYIHYRGRLMAIMLPNIHNPPEPSEWNPIGYYKASVFRVQFSYLVKTVLVVFLLINMFLGWGYWAFIPSVIVVPYLIYSVCYALRPHAPKITMAVELDAVSKLYFDFIHKLRTNYSFEKEKTIILWTALIVNIIGLTIATLFTGFIIWVVLVASFLGLVLFPRLIGLILKNAPG